MLTASLLRLRSALGLAVLASAPLLGCGGGGGDSAGPVALTASNAPEAAKAAIAAALGMQQEDAAAPALLGGGAPSTFTRRALTAYMLRQVDQPAGQSNCDVQGTVQRTVSDNDLNSMPSPGDSHLATFGSCDDTSFAGVLSGTLQLDLSAYSAAPGGVFNLGGSLNTAVSLLRAPNEYTLQGTSTINAARDPAGVLHWSESVGAGFTWQGPVHRLIVLSSTYDTTVQANGDYTVVCSGMVDSTRLGGMATWQTGAPGLSGAAGQWPSLGSLFLTGASGSNVLITALGPILVRIDVDADGDAVFESSFVRSWNSLVH